MAAAMRLEPLGARALRSYYGVVSKHQSARSTFLWTASQTVHFRRHNSRLTAGGVDEERPHANDYIDDRVVSAGPRRPHYQMGSDDLYNSYGRHMAGGDDSNPHVRSAKARRARQPMESDDPSSRFDRQIADDFSDNTSRYKVFFDQFGVFLCDQEGEPIETRRSVFTNLWLRDNCRCTKCVNQETMQRSFNVLATPHRASIMKVTVEKTGVRITWNPDHHESFYSWNFLEHYLHNDKRGYQLDRHMWGAEISDDPPTVEFSEVMDSESGVARMTDLILRFGFVFVDNTPYDDAVHTKRLLERIGPIRETHYGGFYDFIPDMAKADTAYSNIALPAHTDTTYFTDPAGLQAFHLLSHTPSPGEPEVTGGESLLVDGFYAAEVLRHEDMSSFRELFRTVLPWHASGNKGVTITSERLFPVIELESLTNLNSQVVKIRWNNDDRGVLPLKSRAKQTLYWYDAAVKWTEILTRKDSEYWFQLRPGRTLIFNNHRVLHGRSAFTGLRRMCGGYINMDDFMSRWRNTNLPREQVLAQVIG